MAMGKLGGGRGDVLWLSGSIAFTLFVSKAGSYDKTYGSLGAVIILLLWFYLSAYVTLVGCRTERGDRTGRRRHAYQAAVLSPVAGVGTP